jgi:V-type H+-transporting ATPase subunit d
MAGVEIGAKHGGLSTFNTVDGYLEAMFRGFRIDILRPEDYQAMTQQSETLDGEPPPPPRAIPTSCAVAHSSRAEGSATVAPHGLAPVRRRRFTVTPLGVGKPAPETPAPARLTTPVPVADLKQALQAMGSTDSAYSFNPYGKEFLQDSSGQLEAHMFVEAATERLVMQFEHIRAQAFEPLATFLDFVTYSYMIDNILLLLRGSIHAKPVADLLQRCHPLGKFDAMAVVAACESPEELYTTILIDRTLCPVGKYFEKYMNDVSAAANGKMDGGASVVGAHFSDASIEVVRNVLYKAYLEDFHAFCQGLGDVTADCMGEILDFEADRRVVSMKLNLLDMMGAGMDTGDDLNDLHDIFPRCGKLFTLSGPGDMAISPGCGDPCPAPLHEKIIGAKSRETVEEAMCAITEYKKIVDEHSMSQEASYDSLFYKHEVHLNEMSFENQMHYGIFYSFMKLREQEIRNIEWIANCIEQGQKQRINQYLPIFAGQRSS